MVEPKTLMCLNSRTDDIYVFWKLEIVGNPDRIFVDDIPGDKSGFSMHSWHDIKATEIWKQTVKLDDDGHCEVAIPFK